MLSCTKISVRNRRDLHTMQKVEHHRRIWQLAYKYIGARLSERHSKAHKDVEDAGC